jgi:hypothetical protein
MNDDLIKEFARQSGFKVNWQHEDMQAIKMAQYKEFAELIVRECAEVGKQSITRGIGMAITQHALPDYVNGKIEEHFGVEQ